MDLVGLFEAAVLGVLQGLTEFIPVSSTAHLIIGERLLGFRDPGGGFTVMIQLGSILAVMWLYRARILETILGLPTKPEARRFALMLLVAFVPAVVAGIFLADFVKGVLYESLGAIALALLLGGIAMLLIERFKPAPKIEDAAQTPIPNALGIGVFQTLALLPGVSRSGATIFGGLLLGLDRRAAAEFSFFLAMPTMAAAFAHDFYETFIKSGVHVTSDRIAVIAVGFVFAFLSALVVVKPFLNYVTRAGFGPFAWYRIFLGLVLLVMLTLQWL